MRSHLLHEAERHEVALSEDRIDLPASVREGSTEVSGDLDHPCATGIGFGRTKIVTDVVVREHFVDELDVAAIPDLLIEAPDHFLVLGDSHESLPTVPNEANDPNSPHEGFPEPATDRPGELLSHPHGSCRRSGPVLLDALVQEVGGERDQERDCDPEYVFDEQDDDRD